jgi:hypothetical protein
MRMPPRRYFGTPFNRAQIIELQKLLGLERKEYAVRIALRIAASLLGCWQHDEARRQTSDVKSAKRRLDRIAVMAGNLARMLEEEPIAEDLLRVPGSILTRIQDRKDSDDVVSMGDLRQEDLDKLADLIAGLRIVSQNAERHFTDDLTFRCAYRLPRHDDAGKLTFVVYLWPDLFEIWALAGKKLAYTKDGPLHRFISFVHHVCELPRPSASTLKVAVLDWEHKPWKVGYSEDSPWWTWDED